MCKGSSKPTWTLSNPQRLQVLLDGHNIKTLQLRWLRSQVSWPPLLRLPAVARL